MLLSLLRRRRLLLLLVLVPRSKVVVVVVVVVIVIVDVMTAMFARARVITRVTSGVVIMVRVFARLLG